MTKTEKALAASMDQSLQEQAITVCKIERALRAKVMELIPVFKTLDAAQDVITTQGEKALKANPAMAENRAVFRDYCAVVKVQQDMLGKKSTSEELSALDGLRQKFKVVK